MPEVIQKDGVDVTVYTAEELETQKTDAVAAAVAPIQADLVTAKEALSKATDKDANFSTLRLKVEDLEKKQATAREDALAEFEANGRTKMADQAIRSLADNDPELEKKIKFHYSKLGRDAKTDDDVRKAVTDAFVLARQSEAAAVDTAAAFGGASGGAPIRTNAAGAAVQLTENQAKYLKIAYPDLTDDGIKELIAAAKPPKVGPIDGTFGKIVV